MADTSPQPQSILKSPEKLKSLGAILACVTVMGMGLGLTIPLLALLLEGLQVSTTLIGLNTAMPALAGIAVIPFVPAITHRLGVRNLILICLAISIFCLFLFRLYLNIWFWFPVRFAFGAALGVLFVVSEFWVNSLAPEHERGRILGLYTTAMSAGFAVGPVILALVGTGGWAPFLILMGLMAMAAIPVFLGSKMTPVLERSSRVDLPKFLRIAPAAMLAAGVFGALETGVFNFMPIYGVRGGISENAAAICLTAVALGNMLLQYPIGMLADRFDRRLVLFVCAIVGFFGIVTLPALVAAKDLTGGQPLLLYLSLFIWGGTLTGLYTVGLTLLGQRFQGSALISANAAYIVLYEIGALAGPPISGSAMDLWDPHGLVVAMSLICLGYIAVIAYRHGAAFKTALQSREGPSGLT